LRVDAGGGAERCIRHEAMPAELEVRARVALVPYRGMAGLAG
jgi:hypothetical protein